MKASIKFREDQKPLFRAKVPLNILGLPFQSGIVAGESKELSLNLGTFIKSGPSLKISYRPNDSLNPFSLVFKTGIGHFGSPVSSPMTMSAEFNLIGNQNPSFFVHLKPQFGDFCMKKSTSSDLVKAIKSNSNGDGYMEAIESPVVKNEYSTEDGPFSGNCMVIFPSEESMAGSLIGGLLTGTEATAKTVLPLMDRAVVNFHWGLRFPAADEAETVSRRNPTAGTSKQKLPILVMNKIGIELVAVHRSKESTKVGQCLTPQGVNTVGETCVIVKRQLELMKVENVMLRMAIDDLRSEFALGKQAVSAPSPGVDTGKYREGEKVSKIPNDRRSDADKKILN